MSEREVARISVRILEKEYFVACPYEERSDLLDSAEFLNTKMREIRDSGKVVGLDRIAVMAALNLANEVLRARAAPKAPAGAAPIDDPRLQRRIQGMQSAIDQLMAGQEKLL